MDGPRKESNRRIVRVLILAVLVILVVDAFYFVSTLRTHGVPNSQKPIILYVNQGNGVVNGSDLGAMLDFASAHGFNTIFFQVYRQGSLLFSPTTIQSFVNQTHQLHLRIFFAFYVTGSDEVLPSSVYGLGEDGVNLDMSTVGVGAQQLFLTSLKSSFGGQTGVTTTDFGSLLKPDLLILESYGTGAQRYVHHGTIASVGAWTTSSRGEYESEYQYALQNSDGVMVFDYYGLAKAGY